MCQWARKPSYPDSILIAAEEQEHRGVGKVPVLGTRSKIGVVITGRASGGSTWNSKAGTCHF